jgi:glutathione S-transferase
LFLQFEDDRLPLDVATFAHPEFDAMQANGEFVCNMNSVPILTYNGVKLGQSKAINRFVGRKLGFMGSNDVEAAQIDAIADHVVEIMDGINAAIRDKKDEALAAAKESFDLKWYLDLIEKCVGENGFAVGNTRSVADVFIYYILDDVFFVRYQMGDKVNAVLNGCPKLKAIIAGVKEDANVYTRFFSLKKMNIISNDSVYSFRSTLLLAPSPRSKLIIARI